MLLCILAASVLRFASSAPLLRAGSAAEARVRACAPLYVSPSGSDAEGDGSLGSPWATWSHAAAAVRGLLPLQACDVSVYFLSGVYPLTSAVRLSAADSGRNGFSVVYSAAPGASVVFDGGQRWTGGRRWPARPASSARRWALPRGTPSPLARASPSPWPLG